MPRPGPRPYECVRRAWHSDRHQPIRGSLIKEIFRVANEIHSSSTKQNKEWQEKLPTVVLRAEEIMYSKANSESEYMDLKTLWDRTNDAINTIIRCDESSETGQFLQPCIEAALNLGCTPRRSTRSQRNCHPRCYLSSNIPEAADRAGVNYSNLVLTPRCLGSDQRSSVPKNVPQTNSSSSYPLYYGSIPQLEAISRDFVLRPQPVSDAPEPAKDYIVKNNVKSRDVSIGPDPSKVGCDLSLRLGPLTVMVPNPSGVEREQKTLEVKGDTLPVIDKRVSFFPGVNVCDSSDSLERSAEATNMMRKRKAGFDRPAVMEDQQFCLRLKLPFRHLR